MNWKKEKTLLHKCGVLLYKKKSLIAKEYLIFMITLSQSTIISHREKIVNSITLLSSINCFKNIENKLVLNEFQGDKKYNSFIREKLTFLLSKKLRVSNNKHYNNLHQI
jgi:hypothetical protein